MATEFYKLYHLYKAKFGSAHAHLYLETWVHCASEECFACDSDCCVLDTVAEAEAHFETHKQIEAYAQHLTKDIPEGIPEEFFVRFRSDKRVVVLWCNCGDTFPTFETWKCHFEMTHLAVAPTQIPVAGMHRIINIPTAEGFPDESFPLSLKVWERVCVFRALK